MFNANEWGQKDGAEWAHRVGHMWSVASDIVQERGKCDWDSVLRNYNAAVELFDHTGEGAYNDPDLLCAGLDGLTPDEARAQLTPWAARSAPLVIGAKAARLDDKLTSMLQNRAVIQTSSELDVLVGPLSDGSAAVTFVNKLSDAQTIISNLAEI